MSARWTNRYPPTNTALDYVNRHQQRRAWRRRLRALWRSVLPRIARRQMARHDLWPWDVYGIVVPPPQRSRNEFDVILWQRAFYDDEA